MAPVGEPGSAPESDDPFARLGIAPGASFEQVQAARERCLKEPGGDPQAKAKVEAAYDSVLMSRLRERQQGQVSAAAASASERAESGQAAPPSPVVGVLQRFKPRLPQSTPSLSGLAPTWSLVEGQGRIVRVVLGGLALVLLLVSPGSSELVLALGLIGTFLSQVRRGRRPLPSLGWSILGVGAGLLVGAVLVTALSTTAVAQLNLTADQIQALPAALVLLLLSLLLA